MTSTYSTRVCWLQSPKPQHSAPQCAIWQGQAFLYHTVSSIWRNDQRKLKGLQWGWKCAALSYLPPLGGVFSTVEASSQEEEQTNKKVVEGEDLCHHGPLPAQPGHSEQPSSQYCSRTRTCQPDSIHTTLKKIWLFTQTKEYLMFILDHMQYLSNHTE